MGFDILNAEEELITNLKRDMGDKMPRAFVGIARDMIEKNKALIIQWLKNNKDLVREVIES